MNKDYDDGEWNDFIHRPVRAQHIVHCMHKRFLPVILNPNVSYNSCGSELLDTLF